MARRLLILFALLLVVPILWLALPGNSPEPAQPAPGKDGTSEAASAARAVSEVPAAETETEPASRVAALASAPATPEAPPIPADAQWIEVHVVDKASGEPAAGADVAWLDGTTWQRVRAPLEDQQWINNDQESVAQTYGWRARADDRGVARVHLADWTLVFARAGTRYGTVQCNKSTPPPEGYRIELVEDRTLLVQVLDVDGRPAPGVPIAVAQHGADGAFLRLWGWAPLARSEKPDGTARLQHLQEWRDRAWGGEVLVPAAQWRVRLELPGLNDPGIVFDPAAPPAEPVVLRLPPAGSVAVRLEFRGRPVTGQLGIGLYVGSRDDTNAQNRAWNKPALNGAARFPCLPLGRTFVTFARMTMGTFQQEFAGPAAPGQEVTVVLAPSDDQVVLAGRVLDDRQQLLRDTDLSGQVEITRPDGGMHSSSGLSFRTDAEGRFLCFLGKSHGQGSRLKRFWIDRHMKDAVPLRASLAVRDLEPGVNDVGDLVLQPEPLVVAGRFVDAQGPYSRSVAFWVERKGGTGPRDRWDQVQGLTPSQGREGTFEVRGEAGAGQYRLVFGAYDHLPVAPVEFVPGTTDLKVQIARGEQLAGTVLLPPEMPWGVLAVLRPDKPAEPIGQEVRFGGRQDRSQSQLQELRPGRYRFQWQAVPAGTYTLEVRLWGGTEPLASIPGVTLPRAAADGSLPDIDLRDQVAVLTVRTQDAAGKPVPATSRGAFVFLQPLDPAKDWIGYQMSNGAVRMPVRLGPVDLFVTAEGFRPREVRGARGEVSVSLEAWPEVELVFPDLPALPEGCSLSAMLRGPESRERGGYVTGWSSGPRDSLLRPPSSSMRKIQDGRLRLPIGDGVHRLSVLVSEATGRTRAVACVTPVEMAAGAEPIEVRVPADAVDKAFAEAQKAGKRR